ncbi:hypothetical protein QVZ43_15510 [Marinobacter sp. chi1]|uniref:Uncharacterized protein n=1 Tax=Marinobacter suaedae TaxID=3057675 RepID=A0ABT8W4F9_9GAMM|nr:hypothetical protein [Marinobacter sp. chi1]MDO3723127.1 hypothetical protein [Marinobacter sp. chi1]
MVLIDDGNALALRDITGAYQLIDLLVDVTADRRGRPALGLTTTSLTGDLSIGSIELGGQGSASALSIWVFCLKMLPLLAKPTPMRSICRAVVTPMPAPRECDCRQSGVWLTPT